MSIGMDGVTDHHDIHHASIHGAGGADDINIPLKAAGRTPRLLTGQPDRRGTTTSAGRMASNRADRLDRPVDPERDHVLGGEGAEITLVEYGSYVCAHCHAAHEVIRRVRDRFGDRMRYVYRHLPLADRTEATRAAQLAEYTASTTGEFWRVHDALMRADPVLGEGDLEAVAAEFSIPPAEQWDPVRADAAAARVREDARSGLRSGARLTPTFFINERRYEGAWDQGALSEALLRSRS
jgi:Na+:H+ antiporter, NhaA family